MNSLPLTATREETLTVISELKIKALNIVARKLGHKDADYLEPREIKTLTDIVLSIEDSVLVEKTPGGQARAIKRLMEKYGDYSVLPDSVRPTYIEGKVVENG